MKVWELQDDFGIDNLELTEREEPAPEADEVLLEMKAVSPNFRDIMMILGQYNPNQSLPLIPFSDGVGIVKETGSSVSRVDEGDRVCPIFALNWIDGSLDHEIRRSTLGGPLDGTLRERMTVPAESVVEVPDHLNDPEAATLPCAGVTAWNALYKYRSLSSGDRLLLQGTGGVSTYALKFAESDEVTIIQTSSSDEKLQKVRDLGADEVINYEENPEWDREVNELTDGKGVDQIVEVGGSGTLQKSLNAAGFNAQISVIGVLSGSSGELSVLPALMKTLRLQGIFVGSREDFESMTDFMSNEQIHPEVDEIFSFDELKQALKYQQSGQHFGKISIKID